MRTILRIIDSISEWTGKAVRWLCVVLVVVMTYEVIMRYVFNAPTMWVYETAMMLGATIYALALSYVHRHGAHLRVDVFFVLLSPRTKAIIDVVGSLLVFFPLVVVLTYFSVTWAWHAWLINEKMVESYWFPPAAPLRTVVAIGLILFLLQGVAEFIRASYFLIRNNPL